MARTKKKSAALTVAAPAAPDYGPLKPTAVKKSEENWSVYTLEDGTKMRVRPVLIEVGRSKKYNPNGDPIYVFKHGVVINTLVPPRLKKKVKAKS